MGLAKDLIKKTYRGILDTLWFWLVIASLICLVSSYFLVEKHDYVSRLLESIGGAVLVGGVFDITLKSLAYLDIFKKEMSKIIADPTFREEVMKIIYDTRVTDERIKLISDPRVREELTKIVYDPQVLENRKDIEDVWRYASRALYQRRFSAISNQIEDTILRKFFPTDVNFYYDKLTQKISFTFHSERKPFLQSVETLELTIEAADSSEKIIMPYQEMTSKDISDETTSHEFIELNINGVEMKDKFPVTYDRNYDKGRAILISFVIILEGEKEYKVRMTHKRIFDPNKDNTKEFVATKFINGVEVHATFPQEFGVSFFSFGTPIDFQDRAANLDNLIWREYEGLIFPYQGYRLTLDEK